MSIKESCQLLDNSIKILIVTVQCLYRLANFINFTAAAAKSLQSCPTLCDPRDGSPPGSPVPGILQARTGVGCHFLLQSMKVKSEREVAQSCPTPSDPMDCSLPGSSVHGIFQARVLEWGATVFSTCYTIYNFNILSQFSSYKICKPVYHF